MQIWFLGPSLVRKLRGDIPQKYQHVFGEGDTSVSDYLYHCNAPDPRYLQFYNSSIILKNSEANTEAAVRKCLTIYRIVVL